LSKFKETKDVQVIQARNSFFTKQIQRAFVKYGYHHEEDVFVGKTSFKFGFDNSSCVAFIVDSASLRSDSAEELGRVVVLRRIVQSSKIKIRIFEQRKWASLSSLMLRNKYIDTRMKKLPQDVSKIVRKYYFNY